MTRSALETGLYEGAAIMRCRCGGEMRPVQVDCFGRWGNGPRVLVTRVPAWRCERCGEESVNTDTAVRLQQLLRSGTDRRIEPPQARYACPNT